MKADTIVLQWGCLLLAVAIVLLGVELAKADCGTLPVDPGGDGSSGDRRTDHPITARALVRLDPFCKDASAVPPSDRYALLETYDLVESGGTIRRCLLSWQVASF